MFTSNAAKEKQEELNNTEKEVKIEINYNFWKSFSKKSGNEEDDKKDEQDEQNKEEKEPKKQIIKEVKIEKVNKTLYRF